jgi:regulator of protease activity HflC (stomatin/prohibitin superfamily)
MDFSILPPGKVFKAYQTQSVIAERNKQSNIRSVQTQNDRVTISPRALEEFEKAQADTEAQENRKDIADILAESARADDSNSPSQNNDPAEVQTNSFES